MLDRTGIFPVILDGAGRGIEPPQVFWSQRILRCPRGFSGQPIFFALQRLVSIPAGQFMRSCEAL